VHRTIPVRCLPDRIPVKVETDVTNLGLGQHIATQDLKLPEGVSVRLPAEQTLVAVVAPEKEVEEAAPGAPAAGAAAPAAGAAPAAEAKKDEKKEEKKEEKKK
jgi:large subunit ribosomal protein L25